MNLDELNVVACRKMAYKMVKQEWIIQYDLWYSVCRNVLGALNRFKRHTNMVQKNV